MVIGKVGDVPVAAMQGRVHLYEGYTQHEVIFPMRVMSRMESVRRSSPTPRRINLQFKQGCLVVLRDHIISRGPTH